MSQREQARARVLMLVAEGQCTTDEAAALLGLSGRQVRRLRHRFREVGPAALVHGNRGRQPAHVLAGDLRAEVLRLAQQVYRGYNHTHLHEVLTQEREWCRNRDSPVGVGHRVIFGVNDEAHIEEDPGDPVTV